MDVWAVVLKMYVILVIVSEQDGWIIAWLVDLRINFSNLKIYNELFTFVA